jgi:predicted dehydrogenase
MSKKIQIVGAGSIGNHIAHAARQRDWHVTLTDIDADALRRAREDIYPARYGAWDDAITLKLAQDVADEAFDAVYIGTPPDTHLALANALLDQVPPRALIIEKPLSGPDLTGWNELAARCDAMGVFGAVGYNHCLGANTAHADSLIRAGGLGTLQTISTRTREHWEGIFTAHPWLAGPQASYLGFAARGGGAMGEHSHALNIWQHFAHVAGQGRVTEVSATLDWVRSDDVAYDRAAFVTLRTESGLTGDVIQDVVTLPTEKSARLQGDAGFVEWHVNAKPGVDMVASGGPGRATDEIAIPKTRPDDFIAVIDHLGAVLDGDIVAAPIALARGLETLVVIAAVFKSDAEGRRVNIDWSLGYVPAALV